MNLPHTTAQVFFVLLTLLSSSDLPAHFMMKIVILFCLFAVVHGQETTETTETTSDDDDDDDDDDEDDDLEIETELREMYNKHDYNSDMIVTAEDALQHFNSLDQDGDTVLSKEEFLPTFINSTSENLKQNYFNYYDELDGTKDNRITEASFRAIFTMGDTDNNNELSFEEFEEFVYSRPLALKVAIE